MTAPGGQPYAQDDEQAYTGPPPTRRPETWQPVYPAPPWVSGPVPGTTAGPPVRPTPPDVLPGGRWVPPPGTPPHDVPQSYLHAMRSRDWAWWRPLAGLVLLVAVYLAAAAALVLVAVVTGVTPDLVLLDLVDPATLLVTNISLILLIPCVWLAWAVAHGMRIGWSSSVLGRLRWRLILPYTLMALVTLGAGIGLSVLAGATLGDVITGPVPGLAWLLLVVFLTTPLQAAAEEYVFRGYLSQAIAGWFRSERAGAVVAAVVTAFLFALAHGTADVVTLLSLFVFALGASATVWLTGGLEAAIVAHAVNNVLVFTLAALLGDGITVTEVPLGVGLLSLVLTMAMVGAYVALVARSRDRLRPELRTPARDLRPPPFPTPVAPAAPSWLPLPAPPGAAGHGGPAR